MTTSERDGGLAVSVHGPVGVLDLGLPPGTTVADVAREYAVQARLDRVPVLLDRLGRTLEGHLPVDGTGLRAGDVLVATAPGPPGAHPVAAPGRRPDEQRRAAPVPERWSAPWFAAAAVLALLAGWCAARSGDDVLRQVTTGVLALAALVGVLPVGPAAPRRVLAAPACAAAAALVVVWQPGAERLPLVLGTAALAAAVTAAVGRALDERAEEALRVWVLAGSAVFVLAGLCALGGAPPRVFWSLVLLAAVLMARFAPILSVDVPDQLLIDLERLAVTAWSARERPTGRRGRTLVPVDAVAAVAERGARLLTACCVAVLAAVVAAAPLLLASAVYRVDQIGARALVGLAGAALLLAARSYRHPPARAALRVAGLAAWTALAVVLLRSWEPAWITALALVSVFLGALVVVSAVATGRGWRSAWWARRAEVAEGLAGAFAIAAVVVSTGTFRILWETVS